MWIGNKRDHFLKQLDAIRGKKIIIGQPFAPVNYISDEIEIKFVNYKYILENESNFLDVLFFQGYSPETEMYKKVIESGRVGIIATWFWDNHHLFKETTRNSIYSDISFAAHSFSDAYIERVLSVYGGYIPLCPITWSNEEVMSYRKKYFGLERSSCLYGGYNLYDKWPEREVWLREIITSEIPTKINLYPHGISPHPYYQLSREEKFREWSGCKVTLCASFGINTTIRMFDALLTGSTVVLVGKVHDLSHIFPVDQLEKIGVIHVEDSSLISLSGAYHKALSIYDSNGEEGCIARSDYILNNHMPLNRILKMMSIIKSL